MKYQVPIYEKSNLTLEEAAVYFNIGINNIQFNDYDVDEESERNL